MPPFPISPKKPPFLSGIFSLPCVLLFLMCNSSLLNAQITKCEVPNPLVTSIFSTGRSPNCDIANTTQQDYSEIAIYTIFANFHFVADNNGDNFHCDPMGPANLYAPDIVDDIMSFSNSYFTNPQINDFGSPGEVHDARIRIELYTIPGTSGDICGGIFFHSHQTSQSTIRNHSPYGNDVVDIIFNDSNDPAPPTIGGSTGLPGSTYLNVFNMLSNVQNGEDAPWNYARILNHELGHIFNLPHAFSCFNNCYDMDESQECGGPSGCTISNAEDEGELCTSLPGRNCTASWGEALECCHCTWGTGNNFMGYNGDMRGMTPCQWETMFNWILSNDWQPGTFCEVSESALTLPTSANILWNEVKLLNRDVVIPNGTTLTISCEVRMGDNKKFDVKEGGKLIVDGGLITNLCEDMMWAGIYVEGDPTKSQTAANQGTLEVKNNSTIEYAMNAISTSYNGQSSAAGGIIKLEDSEFINNKRSIEFLPYSNSNVSYINNCLFTYNSDYPLNSTIQHITMWNVRDVEIEDCVFANTSGIETDGIYTIDAGFTVQNSDFSGLYQAIYVTNSGSSLRTLTAIDNTFDVDKNGIRVNAVDNIQLTGNELTIGGYSVGTPPFAGILVENSTDFQISGNTHTGISSATMMGTWIHNSGGDPNQVDNNSYEDMDIGNYASDKNRQSYSTGLMYFCNQNENNYIDFYVADNVGTSNEGIGSFQGSSYLAAGNVFTKAGSPTGSDFYNDSDWISAYYYNPTVTSHHPANTINMSVNSTNASDGCSMMMASVAPPESESQLSQVIAAYQDNQQQEAAYKEAYNKNPSDELAAEAARYQMQSHRNMKQILRYALRAEKTNWENVRSWLEKKESFNRYYQIADMLVQNGQSQEAINYLDQAKSIATDETDREELLTFIDLKKLLHQWHVEGKSLDQLGKKEVLQLQTIADRYHGRGSGQAQNILNFWYGYSYLPKYEGKIEKAAERSIPAISNNTAPAEPAFHIAPNPAHDLLTISYTLEATEDQSIEFQITDIFGKQLKYLTLPSGSGAEVIDISDLPDGLYISSLFQNGELFKSIKVIVKD